MLRLSRGLGHWEHLKLQCLPYPRSHRYLTTLAIETSCDDTAVAVLEKEGNIAHLHFNEKIAANNAAHGGIHPLVALESHQEKLAMLVRKALAHIPERHDVVKKHGSKRPDFISVTRGPGMRSNLAVGIDTAKGLAVAWGVPVIGVHHMQAHALTPRLVSALQQAKNRELNSEQMRPDFPFLSLLVSGGHTLLIRSSSIATHKILATTLNNALGDCLDKAAREILPAEALSTAPSTSYGPLLERFAFPRGEADFAYTAPTNRGEEVAISRRPSQFGWHMPAPLLISHGGEKARALEFSFAGVNTYVSYIADRGWDYSRGKIALGPRATPMQEDEARHLAREMMRVCFEHLASRVVLALENDAESRRLRFDSDPSLACKTLVLSGGVAANRFLRHVVREYLTARGFSDVEIVAPPVALCTDNAAMVAWTACEMFEAGLSGSEGLSFRPFRKWSLENVLTPEREEESKSATQQVLEKRLKRQAEVAAGVKDSLESSDEAAS